MKKVNVNSGLSDVLIDIDVVEKKYNVKFVGQFPLKTKDGNWSEAPADIYWQENPIAGHSNYMGLFVQNGTLLITNGQSAIEGSFTGAVANNGEIIYSRYRHDYRASTDGSVFVDGGRDYTRATANAKLITLKVVDGEFYQSEDNDIS